MMTDDHEEVMAETAAITIFQGCKKRDGNFQLSPLSTQSAQRREGWRVVLTKGSWRDRQSILLCTCTCILYIFIHPCAIFSTVGALVVVTV